MIALADPAHQHHGKAQAWFYENHHSGWATCPLTENGFIRIFGGATYPNGPRSADVARKLLHAMTILPGHQFWEDSISLCDERIYTMLPVSKHLTDYYLLALAAKNAAKLATLDARIPANTLPQGERALEIV